MSFYIIWKKPDNTLEITCMAPQFDMAGTVAEKNRLIALGRRAAADFCGIVTEADIPPDRYFRPAWRWDGTKLSFDLPACRARHLQKLRKIRRKLLEATDGAAIAAAEKGVPPSIAFRNYRQGLRDFPQDIAAALAAAQTPEAIKAVTSALFSQTPPAP